MDLSLLAAGPLGTIIGLGGSLFQKWLGMKEKSADHKMKMAEMELMSRVDLQKADIMFRQIVEEKSIDAQAQLKPASPWARDFLALFRPGLTLALMACSTALAFWFHDSKPELMEFIIVSMFSMSSVAVGFWFGTRSEEKFKVTAAARK